jgi:signal transduction histidine kinase
MNSLRARPGHQSDREGGDSKSHPPARTVRVVRTAWISYLVLILAYMISGLPLVYAQTQTACGGSRCLDWQLSAAGLQRLGQTGIPPAGYALYATLLPLFVPLLSLVLVTLVLWRQPASRMAWLFALFLGTCPVNLSMSTVALARVYPLFGFPAQLIEFGFACFLPFVLLFPNGQFVPSWSRWFVMPNVLVFVLMVFFPASQAPGGPMAAVAGAWQLVSALLALGVLIYRYRRFANPVQRRQIKWLLYGLGVTISTNFVFNGLAFVSGIDLQQGSLGFLAQKTITILSIAFFAASLWVAVYRQQLFDIDLVINRTVVYALLTAAVIGLYALAVATFGLLLQTRGSFLISLAATVTIAAVFQPLRGLLQRGVDRLLYGQRGEPYTALAQLGSRLEAVHTTEAILPAIVETIRDTLNLPYVAITLVDDGTGAERRVAAGEVREPRVAIALLYHGDQVGDLIASPRAGEARLSPADRRLLGDFARQAAIAVYAMRLANDLQRSREELVSSREEERRRLRRDLHDGLGPSLATISMQSETARSLVRLDPGAAEAQLSELTAQAQTTMHEVRRLIHALRPPVLDDLGLVPALDALAAPYTRIGLTVRVTADRDLPPLPAAYEVAIYRIAQEALNNVVKHAQARLCVIRLDCETELCLTIQDDGIGIPLKRVSGVGLHSMRERAEELGGTLAITSGEGAGTTVEARLPLRREHGTDPNPDRG